MAAAGDDTIVPTNWGGLIVIAVIVAVVAMATYFGMDYQFGHQGDADKKAEESLSVQDVFSANARREVAKADSARVLSRADLASQSSPANTSNNNHDADQDADGQSSASDGASSDAADDDWGSNASDDWDSDTTDDWDTAPLSSADGSDNATDSSTSDDWDSVAAEAGSDAAASSTTDDWDKELEDSMAAAADSAGQQIDEAGSAAEQAAKDAVEVAQQSTQEAVNKVADAATNTAQETKDAAQAAAAAVTPSKRQRPDAEALRDWWSDASGDLAIRFAGTLDRGDKVSDGIAVMFSDAVSPSQGNQHMQLKNASGEPVANDWKSSRNPNMLIVDGLKPGRYELSIDQTISSQNGKSLNSAANGPLFVY